MDSNTIKRINIAGHYVSAILVFFFSFKTLGFNGVFWASLLLGWFFGTMLTAIRYPR